MSDDFFFIFYNNWKKNQLCHTYQSIISEKSGIQKILGLFNIYQEFFNSNTELNYLKSKNSVFKYLIYILYYMHQY